MYKRNFILLTVLTLVCVAYVKVRAQDLAPSSVFNVNYKSDQVATKKAFSQALTRLKIPVKIKFKASDKVNWGFAINTVCKADKWLKSRSFKKCVTYANGLGFLKGPLSEKVKSTKKITYGELNVLLARVIAAKSSDSQAENQQVDPPQSLRPPAAESSMSIQMPAKTYQDVDFTPVPDGTINKDFFANILLSSPIPTRFYQDEVYFIEGDVAGVAADEAFVFLCPDKLGCDKSENFLEKVDGKHFKIPVQFKKIGNFQMGMIAGRSGQSRIEDISVLPKPDGEDVGGIATTDFSTGYKAGKMIFRWNGQGSFTRLIFFQDKVRQDYIFRQNVMAFAPPSKDFAGFKKGKASWTVKQNGAIGQIQEVSLTKQDFYKVKTESVQVKALQETFASPAKFTFQGRSLTNIAKKVAFTLPNGKVKEFDFASEDLPTQKDFSIEMNLDLSGTYIFEVNDPDGLAVINVPVYVGGAIPLLPDFFTLNEPALDVGSLPSLEEARDQMLALINKDRADNQLPALVLAVDLNSIAQAHSQDMVAKKFFGHVNPLGQSPDDRRKNAGITTPIRENLGKAANLELVEAGLVRSPIHRAAIIDSAATRVGIGIAKNSEGYYLVTQNFAADPVIPSALPRIEGELLSHANSVRASKSLANLSSGETLRSVAKTWSERMSTNDFFSVTDPASNDKLVDALHTAGVNSSIQMYIVKAALTDQLVEQISQQDGINDSSNTKIGIGLAINSAGEIYMTVIYIP
ncbi:MAG: CAP domain-containing protein [Patescibacteria group bacterium]